MVRHQSADMAAGVTVRDPLNHPGLRVSPLARHQDESGAVQVRRFSGPGGNHFHVMHQDASGVTTAEHHMDFPGFASWLRSQPAERRHVLLAPLKLARPTAEIGTTQHQKRIEIARRILAEAGIKPAAVRAVIANGDRAGVLQLLQGNVHPALARYLAAWFGLLTGEQAMTVFHPAKNGEDFLHVVSTAYPPDKLAAYLKSAGAPQFSVESTPAGSRAFLYNPLGKYDIESTLKGLPDASHSRIVGFGSRIGGGTGSGSDARAAYRTVIRDFESSASPAAEARPATGPDLHLARIVDTSHFAEPLHDTYLKHYGHESARRANGESDVFVHDRANRSFYKDPQHQILADYLADHDDPREDIVRGHMQYFKTFGEAWKRAGGTVKQVPFGEEILPRERDYPNPYAPGGMKPITMSDGTALQFRKFSRGGKPPAWIIQWTGPDTLGTHDYTTVMGHQQFKNWLRRFDKDELTRIVKGMRNGR